jgi:transcriptional regulator with XRE-family HTH domain
MRIARNIRLIRELKNYDQRHVAVSMCVGRSTVSSWENGLTEMRIDTLIRLAEVLGLHDYRQIIDFDPELLFRKNNGSM